MSEGRISSHDVVKVKILEICKQPMSINDISKKVGLKRRSVQTNMLLLADYLIATPGYPTLYQANPEKKFEPRMTNQKYRPTNRYFPDDPAPLPFSRELCRMMGITDLVPAKGMHILEGHGSWLNPKPYYGVGGSWMEGG
jgi:hypothetical protein